MIQDKIISCCVIAFSYALIPMVVHNFRKRVCEVPLQTSIVTGLALLVVAGCFYSLALYWSGVLNMFSGILWLTFAAQRLVWRNHERPN